MRLWWNCSILTPLVTGMRVHQSTISGHPLRERGILGTAQVGLRGLQGARAEVLARKYVWWQPPRQTLAAPSLLAAQIMTLGVLEDVQWLLRRVSRDAIRAFLRDPPIGIFNERSWQFWHLQLGVEPIPVLPARPMPA